MEATRFALIFFSVLSFQLAHCKAAPPYVLFSEDEIWLKNRSPNPPYITGDGFRAHCDHILDESNPELSPSVIQDQSAIFVGTHYLGVFFETVHPEISVQYVLVTHNSDEEAPGDFAAYLDDEKIIAWFAQNVEKVIHPKLFPIPIGLENRYCPNGIDFSLLGTMMQKCKDGQRDILLYMNFTPRFRSDRDLVYQLFKDKSYCKYSCQIPYSEYLRDLGRSKFVLSPRGNGLDCLRTWEALYMGAYPVIKKSPCDEMYDDLPVLLVDSWEIVNEEFLDRSYETLKGKEYKFDKIFLKYWLDLIDAAKLTGKAPLKSLKIWD